MQKINSVAHALEVLGQQIDFETLRKPLIAAGMPEGDAEPLIAHYKITKIVEAHNKLNGNWKADWGNYRQYKYSVWKGTKSDESKPSGFGFSSTDCDDWLTDTYVGSRLTVGSREAALYIGNDFEELFEIAWFIIEEK